MLVHINSEGLVICAPRYEDSADKLQRCSTAPYWKNIYKFQLKGLYIPAALYMSILMQNFSGPF